MPRQTRAAARAAEAEQVCLQDTDNAVVPSSVKHHDHTRGIAPIDPEGTPETEPQIQEKPPKKSKRGRKTKGRQANRPDARTLAEEDAQGKEELVQNESVPQEDHSIPRNQEKETHTPIEPPATPTVKRIALQRMAKAASTEEPASLDQHRGPENGSLTLTVKCTSESVPLIPQDTNSTASRELDNKSVDLNQEVKISSATTSLLTSPTIDAPQSEDPIEAIDALEDAIEEMGKILPKLEPLSPEKKSRKPAPTKSTLATQRASRALASKTQSSLSNDAATVLNVSQARSTKPKPNNALLKSTQPLALTRSTSVRATPTTKPSISNTTAKRQSTMAPQKADDAKSSRAFDYLASKRRPISMQFPPPPQPIKSSKPPTKPTSNLPGDAIASRKRAQLEAKLRREEEELAKKREFKARPLPTQSKARPASMLVRQTASSRARLSLIGDIGSISNGEKDIGTSGKGLRRSNTVTVAQSGSNSLTSKRNSVLPTEKTTLANTAQKRTSIIAGSKTQTDANKRSSIIVPKRQALLSTTQPSATLRSTSGSRTSPTSNVGPGTTKTVVSAEEAAVLKHKAREIYNRDRVEKENRERERREKEDAAKRARAEAAEKGRQASREWAEKQRQKLLVAQQLRQQQQAGSNTVGGAMAT